MLKELQAIVGADNLLTDADMRAGYERDWTGRFGQAAIGVVRPGSTGEVAAVLRWCSSNGVSVITQGGNTGLVGGGVPGGDGQLVLSTRRLANIGAVDVAASQVTLGAGVTIAEWRRVARSAGLDSPLDFAARDTATIGGAVATNAGGSRVVRFGTMRRQVLGVEAVLADGTVVGSLAGLPKESAGMHWPSLLTGSEGTLAVVTAARLRLVPRFPHAATAFVAATSVTAALDLLGRARTLDSLDSIELMFPAALTLVTEHLGRRPPVAPPAEGCAVVVELAATADPTDALAALVAGTDGIADAAFATDDVGRSSLTVFRDNVTEAIGTESARIGTPVLKLDVAVPVGTMPDLMRAADDAGRADGCRLIPFGHLAEGNVHLNYLGATDASAITNRVLRTVADLGGTISAEHGIGRAKAEWLPLIRRPGDIAAQRRLRLALDPAGILNPGVLDPTAGAGD